MKKIKIFLILALAAAAIFLPSASAFGTVAEALALAEKVKDYTSLAEFSASEDFSFLYFGDVQFTDDMNSEYADFGKMLSGAYRQNPQIAFAVSCGDMVNSGQSSGQWTAFLQNTLDVLAEVPFFAAAGNHESNFSSGKPELMLQLFDFPQNGPEGFKEEFYSFEYGNCHITVLNSCVFMGEQKMKEKDFSDIKSWLANDLNSAKADFKIVVFHHPPHGVVNDKTGALVLENWCPIFEQYGVDLVLSGHQHSYMRTPDINGVTYLIGNGGKKEYHAVNTENAAVSIENVSCYQIIKVSKDTLALNTYDENHQPLDSWQKQIEKPQPTKKGQEVRTFLTVFAKVMRNVS